VSLAWGRDLLVQDFEGDSAPGWRESGRGTIQFTQYAGNTSLRLSRKKMATLSLSTQSYENVEVHMELAAGGLERADACYAEVSLDGGKTWIVIIELRDGQDDAVTLHSGSASPSGLSNNSNVKLRFRASGKDEDDVCWGDNVRVSTREAAPSAQQAEALLGSALQDTDAKLTALLPMSVFAVPDKAAPPAKARSGRLQLAAAPAELFAVHEDRFDYVQAGGAAIASFPGVAFDWIQVGERLVPIEQGILASDHAAWEIMFQVGYVWQGPDDSSVSYYAMPFALLERNANCTHNGMLAWTIDAAGRASRALFQVASETCAYFKFDMAGRLDAHFVERDHQNADKVLANYRENRSARLPVQAMAALGRDYPGFDPTQLGAVGAMRPDDMTVYGLVTDGRHYRSECNTRAGAYPACDEMLLPSYSTAKSLFGGLALMRLEALLPGARNRIISDLVDECSEKDWGNVSIENALDMATGHYRSTKLEADEALPEHVDFLYAPKHRDKIRFACNFFPVRSQPGTVFAYHSSDTYLAGTAMRALLSRHTGHAVDIYSELIAMPLWQPLRLSAVAMTSRTTYDTTAQALTGWGLTFIPDDIARIGEWLLQVASGTSTNAIDRELLGAALQQNPDDRGLPTGTPGFRYNNGFWAHDIAGYIGCPQPVWVPFMSGYGGISVVLFPNNTLYYYFSDGYTQRWREAAVEINKLGNMCQ
tara:strand:+ start:4168 stop:6288 length:2121 start_codon:yes stop_codon:yes gene_type:complete